MIQDLETGRLKNQFKDYSPSSDDAVILAFSGKKAYVRNEEEKVIFISYGEYKKAMGEGEMPRYLFAIADKEYYLADITDNEELFPGFEYIEVMKIRRMEPKESVMAISTGLHLYLWYRDNRYCGRCGALMEHSHEERMLKCQCGNMVYPRLLPAVIVGVVNGDKMLLTKYTGRAYKRYALIAGFTEIGETVEETVAREVMEEVGIKVKNIRYYKSQPWGFDMDVLMGYYCEPDGDQHITIDESELSVAEWVQYEDIPEDKEHLSLTAEMMQHFKDCRSEGIDL